jgi:hypothetical protein
MMRIRMTSSPENTKLLYETALRLANIVPPYWGLRWSEEAPPEPPSRRFPKKYRYTGGRLPPASALDLYPNWMPALDEEGEPGQDETTIRPDDEQSSISEFTVYTAADAELADGRTVPALLGQPDATFLHKGEVDVIVVYDGNRRWQVETNDAEGRWHPAEGARTKKYGDRKTFPLRVTSRLCLPGSDKKRISRMLYPDGRLEVGSG